MTTTGFKWVKVGDNAACDTDASEVYIQPSPGKLPSLKACQKTCEDEKQCKSITYFKSGWCSHFSTDCSKTVRVGKAVAMRLVR